MAFRYIFPGISQTLTGTNDTAICVYIQKGFFFSQYSFFLDLGRRYVCEKSLNFENGIIVWMKRLFDKIKVIILTKRTQLSTINMSVL